MNFEIFQYSKDKFDFTIFPSFPFDWFFPSIETKTITNLTAEEIGQLMGGN